MRGVDPVSIEKALTQALGKLEKLLTTMTEEGPRGSLTSNLRETVANVREMTANLNDLIATTKPEAREGDGRAPTTSPRSSTTLLEKSNLMMAGLATDKGAVGALLHDEKVKEDVKETIADVKEAAGTAKDVFGRITSSACSGTTTGATTSLRDVALRRRPLHLSRDRTATTTAASRTWPTSTTRRRSTSPTTRSPTASTA